MFDNLSFEQAFFTAKKMGNAMIFGLLFYMGFVEICTALNWDIYYYVSYEALKITGFIFIFITVLFFPLNIIITSKLTKGALSFNMVGQKLLKSYVIMYAMSEIVTVFGLVIFIISSNKGYFYLFFTVSLLHLLIYYPKYDNWIDKAEDILKK